jgi:hypothetical protein
MEVRYSEKKGDEETKNLIPPFPFRSLRLTANQELIFRFKGSESLIASDFDDSDPLDLRIVS